MKRSRMTSCLFAVLPLLFSVIWHEPAAAAVAPTLAPLGQIREGLRAPTRIDVDAAGNLYVADVRAAAVFKFDMYGKLIATFAGVPISGGLAVSADGARLYVAGQTSVAILDGASGALLGHLGGGANEFGYVFELAIDSQGFVFTADSASLLIRVFDPIGRFQYAFGGKGTGNSQFNGISALAVDRVRGEVFVGDSSFSGSYSPRVQVFSLGGTLLRVMNSSSGFGPAPVYSFSGIAFDHQARGYFLNDGKSQLVFIGLPATYLATYGSVGFDTGKLLAPWDVAFDAVTSRLFVLCGDSRIEIFGIDGGTNPVRRNAEPGQPAPVSPVAGSEVNTARPELVFQNAEDADGDPLVYNLRLYQGEQVISEYSGLPEAEGQSSLLLDSPLGENARYAWSVQASDGESSSPWTSPQPFYVNAIEEAPEAPVLAATEEFLDGSGILAWTAASDPDPFDKVGYRLQIAGDPTFTQLAAEELLDATRIGLGDCTGYSALADGERYHWRVLAIDEHGLVSEASATSSFIYDTTLLRVTANVPGALVYLGGNHAFAGRPLGEAPLEARDLVPGVYSIIVERPGLETFLVQKTVDKGQNASVAAELKPALGQKKGEEKLLAIVGENAAPFLIDLDNDGMIDLLVGDGTGSVTLFKGTASLQFAPGVLLGRFATGAVPFVADWNNDGRKDLLVGADDGTVSLYLNEGSEAAPSFAAGSHLVAAGAVIAVPGGASPLIHDFNGDGAKDLLIGSGDGSLLLFLNKGSDAVPVLAAPSLIAQAADQSSFFLTDWNADGQRDLLVVTGSAISFFERQSDGTFGAPVAALTVGSGSQEKDKEPGGANGQGKAGEPMDAGVSQRLFACDLDGSKGKDLLVGSRDGKVSLLLSSGHNYLPSFQGAMLAKVGQIEELSAGQPPLAGEIAALRAAIVVGDYKEARKKCDRLVATGELAAAVSELSRLLK